MRSSSVEKNRQEAKISIVLFKTRRGEKETQQYPSEFKSQEVMCFSLAKNKAFDLRSFDVNNAKPVVFPVAGVFLSQNHKTALTQEDNGHI